MKEKAAIGLLLISILGLGIFLRYHNISPFKIYPDAYQNLLVAENIKNYTSVLGYLGPQGSLYPEYFSWSRFGYALLIIAVDRFTNNGVTAAQNIAFAAGIAGMLMAFLLVTKLFRSYWYGVTGALLLAISFNHTVWSGFIMTETVGVVALLLFLLSLISHIKKPPSFINPGDSITGLLLGYAILTRYEYIVICIPLLFFILFTHKKPFIRLMIITCSALITIGILFLTLFPIQSTFQIIWKQLPDQLTRLFFMILILIIGLLLPKNLWYHIQPTATKWLPYSVFFFPLFFFMTDKLLLFKKFFLLDFFLSIFSIIGIFLLLQHKTYRPYGYFAYVSCLFLGIMYQNINTAMDRYITHLIPFLIIPASYGLVQTIHSLKKRLTIFSLICFVSILVAGLLQLLVSYRGLRYMQDSSWFRISYEEQVAKKISNNIPSTTLLIAALPEPYFYTTQLSSYSLTDNYPYIFIPHEYNKKQVVIVEDIALRNMFPTFTDFLHKYLNKHIDQTFFIHERFRLKNTAIEEKNPVIIYRISLDEFKKYIEKAHRHRNTP